MADRPAIVPYVANGIRPSPYPPLPCIYCGAPTHSVEWCSKTWAGSGRLQSGEQLHCGYCGSTTHNFSACPQTPDTDWETPQFREPAGDVQATPAMRQAGSRGIVRQPRR